MHQIIVPWVSLPTAGNATCQWITGREPFSLPQTTGGEMKTRHTKQLLLLIWVMSIPAACAFGAAAKIKSVSAAPDGDAVHIDIDLTSPVKPIVRIVGEPSRLIIDFPDVSLDEEQREIIVNHTGVREVSLAMSHDTSVSARIVVGIDAPRPFGIETSGNKL